MTFDDGALSVSDGKADIIKEFLAGRRGRSLLIGDGFTDLMAGEAVDLFIGFGGFVQRARVREQAPVFVKSTSLAPILALAAGPAALVTLENSDYRKLSQIAFTLIEEGAITFTDKHLQERFEEAVAAARQTARSRFRNGLPADLDQPEALDDWSSTAAAPMNDL
jgi:phosphoserine phosphatase